MNNYSSVTVVIPTYNMAWCIARAVNSCQTQSLPVSEIIVVDDCSSDNTEAVVRDLMIRDPRIRYFRLQENQGHLAALRLGTREAVSDWVALLDADDELTPNSIEARIIAASEYEKATGVTPQLVYGDHESSKFRRLQGYIFPYLCKELCLCQTSTMMLGREGLSRFPVTNHPFNTDDEIVLEIGKHFHVLHSGAVVTIYHTHDSPIRMSNNSKKVFEGVCELVRDHRADIVREQGRRRLLLWRVRILNAFINYKIALANAKIAALQSTFGARYELFLVRAYLKALTQINLMLKSFLSNYFECDYF